MSRLLSCFLVDEERNTTQFIFVVPQIWAKTKARMRLFTCFHHSVLTVYGYKDWIMVYLYTLKCPCDDQLQTKIDICRSFGCISRCTHLKLLHRDIWFWSAWLAQRFFFSMFPRTMKYCKHQMGGLQSRKVAFRRILMGGWMVGMSISSYPATTEPKPSPFPLPQGPSLHSVP